MILSYAIALFGLAFEERDSNKVTYMSLWYLFLSIYQLASRVVSTVSWTVIPGSQSHQLPTSHRVIYRIRITWVIYTNLVEKNLSVCTSWAS